MMETAVRCIKHYDSGVLDELVPSLIELTKRGIGVPTKVTYICATAAATTVAAAATFAAVAMSTKVA